MPGEVFFLKKMNDHPNVIKFLHYQQISPETFAIVTERPNQCKDLRKLVNEKGGTLSEAEARKFAKTLVNVAANMEEKGFVHRDLKLENILYDCKKDAIKLIDFGMATEYKPGQQHSLFDGK